MFEFTAYKSTASNVKLRLGLLTFAVDLVSAMPDDKEDTAFKYGCPHDHSGGAEAAALVNALAVTFGHNPTDQVPPAVPAPVSQAYLCDHEGHGPYRTHELCRIRQVGEITVDDKGESTEGPVTEDSPWVMADPEEIIAAKVGTLAKGTVDLAVHPADQVLRSCRPGKKGYLLRPTKTKGDVDATDGQMYGLLLSLVDSRPDLALVGALRLRDNRCPYRITVFDGQLYLEEVVLPDQVRERDVIEVDVAPAQAEQLGQLAEQLCTDFDPTVHSWDAGAAVKVLMAEKAVAAAALASGEKPKKAAPAAAPVLDLDAMLATALAGAAPTAAAA